MSIGTPNGQLIIENATVVTNNINVQDKVGVATDSPSYNLDVHGTANVGVLQASYYIGDGGLLSNIATDLQKVSDNGNTTTNTLEFRNPTTAFITDLSSNVGINIDQLENVSITSPAQADQLLMYDGSNWINDFSLHNFIKVYNDTGDTLHAGNAVYIVNSHNQNVANVALAKSDSNATMPAIGLVHEDILDNGEGVVVAYGKVSGINTASYTEGQTVYVSNAYAGHVMNTKPYGLNDLIQNVGICVRVHKSNGVVFVTGVGRSNDIPNAPISSSPNYVYVNESNNDMRKIAPENLLTKLQTLEQVVNAGNTVSNVIQVTGIVSESVSVTGLTPGYVPFIGADNHLEDSSIRKDNGNIIISADTEISGNLFVSGNSYVVSSNNVVIEDRILGIANNNPSHDYDTGIIMQHPGHNVALIHHGDEDRFSMGYTQNTLTDDHILPDSNIFLVDVLGDLIAQNSITVNTGYYYGDGSFLSNVANDTDIVNLRGDLQSNVDILRGDLQSNVDILRGDLQSNVDILRGDLQSNVDILRGDLQSNVDILRGDLQSNVDILRGDLQSNVDILRGEISRSNTINFSNVVTGLTVDSNVIVGGNVTAQYFTGDGSNLTGVVTSLNNITEVDVNTGVSNTTPSHTLDVGSNLYVDDIGSNVLVVSGNVLAHQITLDSIRIASVYALEYVTMTGKTTSNTVEFRNPDVGLVTTANVGISNTNPIHTLDVGSNLWVDDTGTNVLYVSGNTWCNNLIVGSNLQIDDTNSNVLAVDGNVSAHNLWIGSVEIAPSYSLEDVTAVGNVTSKTVQFTNPDISIVASSGIATHIDAFTRKTYSYSNVNVPANFSNIGFTFTPNAFYARVTAQLTHGNEEVSTLMFDAQGGTRDGSVSSLDIAATSGTLFGNTNTKPWSATIQKTPTQIILEPSAIGAVNYGCDIYVEYMCSSANGKLESINIDADIVKVFQT